MEKRYYQKEIETMPVEDLKKLQSEKLVKQVKHVYENVPYYKKLMDEKGVDDVACYKKANVSKQTWHKILSDPAYKPSKNTVLSFAIALELNLEETLDFIGRAGYTLSHSSRFDIIIEYFIKQKNYDIFAINEALFAFDQSLLGA